MPEDRWEALRSLPRGVVPPKFGDIVHTARRRRTGAVLSVAAVVVLALGASSLSVALTNDDAVRPAHTPRQGKSTPQPTKTTRPHQTTTVQPSPAGIISAPGAYVASFAVSPGNPASRAALWTYCPGRYCRSRQFNALTVTADGFRTRHDIALPRSFAPTVTAVGNDSFYVATGADRGLLVDTRGMGSRPASRPVIFSKTAAPLAAGEVLVSGTSGTGDVIEGLDPASGRAHPIPVPPGIQPVQFVSRRQLLLGLGIRMASAGTMVILRSTDGGASWRTTPVTTGGDELATLLPSAPTAAAAIAAVGDDAVVVPTFERSEDGGQSWHPVSGPPAFSKADATLTWAVIRPDGRLLVYVDEWGVAGTWRRPTNLARRGLYESSGADWSQLHPLAGSLPLPGSVNAPLIGGNLVLAQTEANGTQLLVVNGRTRAQLLASVDGGRHWTTESAR